ncbi:MAG: DUF2306 domain-containing protein [Parvibaculales bacterium]
MAFIWIHLGMAVAAIVIGVVNLAATKGTPQHKKLGWVWMGLMAFVTLSSLFIRELNDGSFSWIHGLTAWTMFCMVVAIVAIRRGDVRTHAGFMTGTMIGAVIAGGFAMVPGRFIAGLLGG